MCVCHCHNAIKLRCIHNCEIGMGDSELFRSYLFSMHVASQSFCLLRYMEKQCNAQFPAQALKDPQKGQLLGCL